MAKTLKLLELAHDKSAGGEAQTGDDGKGELDGHDSVQDVIQSC